MADLLYWPAHVWPHAPACVMSGADLDSLDRLQLPEPVVARLSKVSKHPKADRLKVCQADTGAGGMVQVGTC